MEKSISELLNSGLQAHRQGRLAEAEQDYVAALQRAPDNFDALQLLGMLRHQQGRIPEAAGLFERALELRPGDTGTLNRLSALLLAAGDADGAASKARLLLAHAPEDAFALYVLGSAQRIMGQSDDAAAALEKSLAIRPEAPDARNLLGIIRHEQGRFADAAGHFEIALQLHPGHPEYLNNLGFALLEAGRPTEARPYLEAAVAARPGFGEALVNLGRAMHELGFDEQAIETFKLARGLNPRVAAVPVNLGVALRALNRPREAEQAFLAALDIQPDNIAATANLAAVYESGNQTERAEQTARRGLSIAPDDPFLNLVAAKCERRRGEFDNAGQRLERILAEKPAEKWSQALHYEFVRVNDGAGDYEKAMASAMQANRLARQSGSAWLAVENPYNRMLGELVSAANGNWIDQWSRLTETPDSATPVFLVGFPRSGTTLLDSIIGSHPDFAVLEEKPALEAVRKALDLQQGGFIPALGELDEAGRSSLVAQYWSETEHLLQEPLGERRLLDKLPLNIVMLPLIERLFPGAQIILALRHPADVCLSCFFQEFDYRRAPAMANFLSMQETVDFYGKVIGLWQRYEQKLSLNVHTVRYENLVENLEAESRRLFGFLGSPWDASVLEFHKGVHARGTIDTPSYHQVAQPVYTRARYRWRRYDSALAPWMDTLHTWAELLGYERPPGTKRIMRDDAE